QTRDHLAPALGRIEVDRAHTFDPDAKPLADEFDERHVECRQPLDRPAVDLVEPGKNRSVEGRPAVVLGEQIKIGGSPRLVGRELHVPDRRAEWTFLHADRKPSCSASRLDPVPVGPGAARVLDELHVVEHDIDVGAQKAVKEAEVWQKVGLVHDDCSAHSDRIASTTRRVPSSVMCASAVRLIRSTSSSRVKAASPRVVWRPAKKALPIFSNASPVRTSKSSFATTMHGRPEAFASNGVIPPPVTATSCRASSAINDGTVRLISKPDPPAAASSSGCMNAGPMTTVARRPNPASNRTTVELAPSA